MDVKNDEWGTEHLKYQENISIVTAVIIISSILHGIILTHPYLVFQPEMVLTSWISSTGLLLIGLVSLRYDHIKKLYQPKTNKEAIE